MKDPPTFCGRAYLQLNCWLLEDTKYDHGRHQSNTYCGFRWEPSCLLYWRRDVGPLDPSNIGIAVYYDTLMFGKWSEAWCRIRIPPLGAFVDLLTIGDTWSSPNRGFSNTTSTLIHSSNDSPAVTTKTTAVPRWSIMTALTGAMQCNTPLCLLFEADMHLDVALWHWFRRLRNRSYRDYMLHIILSYLWKSCIQVFQTKDRYIDMICRILSSSEVKGMSFSILRGNSLGTAK
jgi:hypothetical protein